MLSYIGVSSHVLCKIIFLGFAYPFFDRECSGAICVGRSAVVLAGVFDFWTVPPCALTLLASSHLAVFSTPAAVALLTVVVFIW